MPAPRLGGPHRADRERLGRDRATEVFERSVADHDLARQRCSRLASLTTSPKDRVLDMPERSEQRGRHGTDRHPDPDREWARELLTAIAP
jgi:hypothetical protein